MKIHFQNKTGDTAVDLETETDLAVQLFAEAIANGKMAYAITKENGNHIIFELDNLPKDTERVVVCNRQIGG